MGGNLMKTKGNLMSILIKKTFKKPDGIPFPKPSGFGGESDRHSQRGENGDIWLTGAFICAESSEKFNYARQTSAYCIWMGLTDRKPEACC